MNIFIKSYAYYVLLLIVLTLMNFFAVETNAFSDSRAFSFFSGLAMLFALKFTQTFLLTQTNFPKLDKAMMRLMILLGIGAGLGFFTGYQLIVKSLVVMEMVLAAMMLLAGYWSWRRNYRPAGYFLLAFGVPLTSAGISGLIYGMIPHHLLIELNSKLGTIWLMLFLSLALADHLNQLKTQVESRATQLAEVNERLKASQRRFQQELALASEIQQSLLPSPRPNWANLDVICFTSTASEVGGDFYAYYAFEAKKPEYEDASTVYALPSYALAVGDISGKGVSAALLMSACLAQFNMSFSQTLTPSERMAYLDKAIMPYTEPHHLNCGLCYVEITPFSSQVGSHGGIVRAINADGIPPYIRSKDGQVKRLDIGGFALGEGLGAESGYQQTTLTLNSGDIIVMISDGVVESQNTHDEKFGFERLTQAIAEASATSATDMLAHLIATVTEFMDYAEPHDDLTFVVVKL